MQTDTNSDPHTLGDALPLEIQRCQDLLSAYESIGPAGTFGAAMIRHEINKAHQAMISGDVIGMLQSYQALKEFKD